jgi:hypothetical protein
VCRSFLKRARRGRSRWRCSRDDDAER